MKIKMRGLFRIPIVLFVFVIVVVGFQMLNKFLCKCLIIWHIKVNQLNAKVLKMKEKFFDL